MLLCKSGTAPQGDRLEMVAGACTKKGFVLTPQPCDTLM